MSGNLAVLTEPETEQSTGHAAALDPRTAGLASAYAGSQRTRVDDTLFGMMGILVVAIILGLGVYSVARYLF